MGCVPEATTGDPPSHRPRETSAWGARDAHGIGGAVQQIVTTLLPDGHPDVRSVAKAMRLSTRTLQRRLSNEGITFMRVVAQARYAVARQMLDDPARKVIDIALDLGYSDPAHFARAFARWTGLAPREFRRLRAPSAQRRDIRDENCGPDANQAVNRHVLAPASGPQRAPVDRL
jgi:AraC-like DNA-binding protein